MFRWKWFFYGLFIGDVFTALVMEAVGQPFSAICFAFAAVVALGGAFIHAAIDARSTSRSGR